MKKAFRWIGALRAVGLASAALALQVSDSDRQPDTGVYAAEGAQIVLPAGLRAASTQTGWHAIAALAY